MLRTWITTCLIVPLIAGHLSVAHAQENPVLPAIKGFVKAFNSGDAGQLSPFYAEKAALMPPRHKLVNGRAAIQTHFANAFRGGVGGLNIKLLELDQAGPQAVIEIGRSQVRQGNKTITGRYLHVWKQVADRWLITRDIYHVLDVK